MGSHVSQPSEGNEVEREGGDGETLRGVAGGSLTAQTVALATVR